MGRRRRSTATRRTTRQSIDGEIGDLAGNVLGGTPLFRYLRYNVELTAEGIAPYMPNLNKERFADLTEMDKVKNMELLKEIGEKASAAQIVPGHLPPAFDLEGY